MIDPYSMPMWNGPRGQTEAINLRDHFDMTKHFHADQNGPSDEVWCKGFEDNSCPCDLNGTPDCPVWQDTGKPVEDRGEPDRPDNRREEC